MIQSKFSIPIFGHRMCFLLCSHADLPDNDDITDEALAGFCHDDQRIWVNEKKNKTKASIIQSASHEATHAAFSISMDIAGGSRPRDIVGEELVCYLQDFILGKIIKAVDEQWQKT